MAKATEKKLTKNEHMAELMYECGDEWLAWHEAEWGPDADAPDDGMLRCGAEDAKDLRVIGETIAAGDILEARKSVEWLDTIVRDSVPDAVWDYVHDEVWDDDNA